MSGFEQDADDQCRQKQTCDQPEPPAFVERNVFFIIGVGTVEVFIDRVFDLVLAGAPVHFPFGLRQFVFELSVLLNVFLCAFMELNSGPLFGLFVRDFVKNFGVAFVFMEIQFLHSAKLLYLFQLQKNCLY